ncbi:hypothetical protein [Phyllobacterium leguminum]|uniref:hypothetical protein n=1 Tax=Phyllobacterium leguminum TaxID=314237 RepID=UPI000DA11278|nr:hypothetical protein [Phyllobacterium leguminum]
MLTALVIVDFTAVSVFLAAVSAFTTAPVTADAAAFTAGAAFVAPTALAAPVTVLAAAVKGLTAEADVAWGLAGEEDCLDEGATDPRPWPTDVAPPCVLWLVETLPASTRRVKSVRAPLFSIAAFPVQFSRSTRPGKPIFLLTQAISAGVQAAI